MSDAKQQIETYLSELPAWKREMLEAFRAVVHDVEPAIEEDWKWGVPVFLVRSKLVCGMSAFTGHIKVNFFEGARLSDPQGLFNSGLDSKKHRSINFTEQDRPDWKGIAELVREAIALA